MAGDDDKKLILARRAKFVAAALAGVSVACGKDPAPPPQPCLSVPMQHGDAGPPEPPPQPCLTPVMQEAYDAGPPATESDAGPPPLDAGAPRPMPCLVPPLPSTSGKPPPHPPRPCLSVVKPPDKGTK